MNTRHRLSVWTGGCQWSRKDRYRHLVTQTNAPTRLSFWAGGEDDEEEEDSGNGGGGGGGDDGRRRRRRRKRKTKVSR